jgi:transcriptional regulator with XRE-family HTH domain
MIITAGQVREARKLVNLTLPALIARSGVDAKHLDAFERGKRRMSVLDLSVIQRVLGSAGVKFTSEHGAVGVRLRNPHEYHRR